MNGERDWVRRGICKGSKAAMCCSVQQSMEEGIHYTLYVGSRDWRWNGHLLVLLMS